MIHLKWKPDHAVLLHLTQKKIQSPNNGRQGSPSSGSHARPYLSALLLTWFWTAKHTPASKPLPLFPLLQTLQDQLPYLMFYSSATFSEKSSPKTQHIISKLSLCFLRSKGLFFQAQIENVEKRLQHKNLSSWHPDIHPEIITAHPLGTRHGSQSE